MASLCDGLAVGIDLGTTYSCVAVWQHDRVEIIANDQGNRTTPSYVAFTETERLIGEAAKNDVAMNPTNTVFGAYNFIFIFYFVSLVRPIKSYILQTSFSATMNGIRTSIMFFTRLTTYIYTYMLMELKYLVLSECTNIIIIFIIIFSLVKAK
jgi:Hsp70 protein